MAFAQLTSSWETRILANAANGNFRIVVRADSSSADAWSFAVEWNRSYRVIGFFGNSGDLQSYVDGFPVAEMIQISPTLRLREEISLAPEEDIMFEDPRLG
jgi:hypothetical protein